MSNIKRHPIVFILLFFITCSVFRAIEYFVIRTDQSIIGEAFLHKLIGIGLLAAAIRYLGYRWSDIGFRAENALKGIFNGLLFGVAVFAVAYGAELLISYSSGNIPSIQFYLTSYTVNGNRAIQGGAILVLICILGNIINVVMEEGIFRGLFVRFAEEKYSFTKACIIASLLFGFWHIAAPVRNVVDGLQSPMGAFMMGLMLVGTSTLAGIQYVMLYKMTGALWVSMAFHFVNNTSVNLLHIVTESGADELQPIRLTITGTISFIVVLIMFLRHRMRKNNAPNNLKSEIHDELH